MAIRDKLRTNAAPYLQPGEQIQVVFSAQTVSAYFSLISVWIIVFSNALRVVVVTDRRILLCKSGRFRSTPVTAVLGELPRPTIMGPAHGLWYRTDVFGQKLYVNRRYHKDIATADELAGPVTQGQAPPA